MWRRCSAFAVCRVAERSMTCAAEEGHCGGTVDDQFRSSNPKLQTRHADRASPSGPRRRSHAGPHARQCLSTCRRASGPPGSIVEGHRQRHSTRSVSSATHGHARRALHHSPAAGVRGSRQHEVWWIGFGEGSWPNESKETVSCRRRNPHENEGTPATSGRVRWRSSPYFV